MKKYLSLLVLSLFLIGGCNPSTGMPASEIKEVSDNIKAHLNNPLHVSPAFTSKLVTSVDNYQIMTNEVFDFNNYYYYNLTQVSSDVSEIWFYVEDNTFYDARIEIDGSATYKCVEFLTSEEAKDYFNNYVTNYENKMGPSDIKELTLSTIENIIDPMLEHLVLLEAGEEQLKPEFNLSYYLSSEGSGAMYFSYDLSDGKSRDYYNILIEDNLVTLASALNQNAAGTTSSDIEIYLTAVQQKPNLDDFVLIDNSL